MAPFPISSLSNAGLVPGMRPVSEKPQRDDKVQHTPAEDRGRHNAVHPAVMRGVFRQHHRDRPRVHEGIPRAFRLLLGYGIPRRGRNYARDTLFFHCQVVNVICGLLRLAYGP